MSFLTPTPKRISTLFFISFALIFSSYIFYNYIIIGTNSCASPCESWLSPILSEKPCIESCTEKPIPLSIYKPLLQSGTIIFILTIIYTIIYFLVGKSSNSKIKPSRIP
jgi:hypothetical protein